MAWVPTERPSLVFLPGSSCPSFLSYTPAPHSVNTPHPPLRATSLCPPQIGAVLHPSTSCRWWSFAPVTVCLGTDPRGIYPDAMLSSRPLPVAPPSARSLVLLIPDSSPFPISQPQSPAPSVVPNSLIGPAPPCPSRLEAFAAQLDACPARSPTPRPLRAPRSGWAGPSGGGSGPSREGGRS